MIIQPLPSSFQAMANPNHYRTAILIDATGQANGTGYAASETRHAQSLTYSGNAAIASEKFEFDGTGDVITVPHSILWTPGSKFTIGVLGLEFDAVNTGTIQGVMAHYSADVGSIAWALIETGGQLIFQWSDDGVTSNHNIVIDGAISAGVEYDVSVAWDGSTVYSVINEQQGGSDAFVGTFFDSGQALRFGALANGGSPNQYLNGRFTAAYLTRGETLFTNTGNWASQSLPLTLDNPALTDSEWGNVLMLWGYDDDLSRIRDFGPLDLPRTITGTVAGSTGVTLGDGTPTIQFDGSTGYIEIVDDPILEVGSSAWTLETFARHSVNTANNQYVTKYNSVGNRSLALGYRGDEATDVLRSVRSNDGNNNTQIAATWTPVVNTMYHVAFGGSGGNMRSFIDGTQAGSTTAYTGNVFDGNAPWRLGIYNSGGLVGHMNGYLTQIRVTKANRYTSNFTAPSGALPIG